MPLIVSISKKRKGPGFALCGTPTWGCVGLASRDAPALFESEELFLKCLVLPDQSLQRLVAVLFAPELPELLLEPLDVLLCPRPNGALSFPVISPLAGE